MRPSRSNGSASRASRPGQDPCLQIQVDLSAMLDGELDPASVRRVTVHSDVCPSCRAFFDGIRHQVGLHKRLQQMAQPADGGGPIAAGGKCGSAPDDLHRQLTVNQRKLSRILYELGRNFALMGLSPDFSREVAKEPMPVPDVAMRARNLLDEVARSPESGSPEWVAAHELFDGQLRTPEENLARGQRLLTECLALDPEGEDARIYLGLVHYARGQRLLARKQFEAVLDRTADSVMCGYALSNLSNILLDEGDTEGAIELLERLIASDATARQPRLIAALFNLALAYGLKLDFASSMLWFQQLHDQAPHRRRWAAHELSRRSHFLHLVHTHPAGRKLAESLPMWFPIDAVAPAGPGDAGIADGSPFRRGAFGAGGFRR